MIYRKVILWSCLLLGAGGGVCSAAEAPRSSKKYSLEGKFQPGIQYMVMQLESKQDMQMDQAQGPAAAGMTGMVMRQLMVVKMDIGTPDPQGCRKVILTYERIRQSMRMGNGGVRFEYDSLQPDKAQASPMGRIFAPLLKTKIEILLGKDDKVISVKGMESMWKAMADENPRMRPMLDTMKKTFGDESVKKMILGGMENMPQHPVAIGDKWEIQNKMDIPFLGEMNIKINMKLLSVAKKDGREIAEIEMTGTVTGTKGKGMEVSGVIVKLGAMKITQKGKMFFDLKRGQMIRSDIDQKISMAMQSQGQQQATSMSMKIDAKSKIQITLYFGKAPPELTVVEKPKPKTK